MKEDIKQNKLQLIPKAEKYIEYMIQVIMKLPRIEKFNIGSEYKLSMYEMLRNLMQIFFKEHLKSVLFCYRIRMPIKGQNIITKFTCICIRRRNLYGSKSSH